MKTITILGLVSVLTLSLVSISYASIDKNLKYGQRDKEVTELQEFLIDGGFLKGTPTTFFGLLTLKAVKAYQNGVGVSPTGYVGILTRQKINDSIALDLASSTQAEVQETGTTTQTNNSHNSSSTTTTITSVDYCKNIEGIQTKVPDGMFMNGDGICFTPTISQPTIAQPTNYQPIQSASVSNNSVTQIVNTSVLGSVTIEAVDPTINVLGSSPKIITKIVGGSVDMPIAQFTFTGHDEDVKIDNLTVTPIVSEFVPSNAGLNNVAVYVNGGQISTNQNWLSGSLVYNLGSSLIVSAGKTLTVTVRADTGNPSTGYGYTSGFITASVGGVPNNARGLISNKTLTVGSVSVQGKIIPIVSKQ